MMSKNGGSLPLVIIWLVGLGMVSGLSTGFVYSAQEHAQEHSVPVDSREVAEQESVSDVEADQVPAEVLRAIYPHQSNSLDTRETGNQSYFEQANSTPMQLGSSVQNDIQQTGAQFNDHLVDQMNTGSDRVPVQPVTSQVQASDSDHPPTQEQTEQEGPLDRLRNRLDETANRQGDHPAESQIIPATHIAPIEPATLPVRIAEPVRKDRSRESNANYAAEAESNGKSDLVQPDTRNITIAEMLESSNRAKRSQANSSSLAQISGAFSDRSTPGRPATPSLTETIQRIAVSLCLILTVACLLLVGAKRWWFGARASTTFKSSRAVVKESPIQILNQIQLDAKSQLFLVRANSQQVLVAVDAAGIKSVLPLPSDFGSALEELSRPVETGSRSIVQAMEEELGQSDLYTPASVRVPSPSQRVNPIQSSSKSSNMKSSDEADLNPSGSMTEIEMEMKKKLAELLRVSLLNQK